jgi:hypothetical protein
MLNYNIYTTTSMSLASINDYGNITVPSGGALVYFSLQVNIQTTSDPNNTAWGNPMIWIGTTYPIAAKHVWLSGTAPLTGTAYSVVGCIIYLSAGTYDVRVFGQVDNSATILSLTQMSVGIVGFNDSWGYLLTYIGSGTTTISNVLVNGRTTPLGSLNQAVCGINVGTNGTAGSSLSVTVDGTTVTPDEDAGVSATGYNVYKYYVPVSVGTSHTVALTVSSGYAAYVSVVMTPWLLTTSYRNGHTPITLNFPQNSTLYVNLGSLYYDTTKYANVGSKKAVSWGQDDYYYSSSAGTGVLAANYTYTSVNVALSQWSVSGLGGCIENIGVDMP